MPSPPVAAALLKPRDAQRVLSRVAVLRSDGATGAQDPRRAVLLRYAESLARSAAPGAGLPTGEPERQPQSDQVYRGVLREALALSARRPDEIPALVAALDALHVVLTPSAAEPVRRDPDEEDPREALSAREREVLDLVALALSNRQIASRLGITEGTVKRHLHNIFGKLDAVSRIDAVNKCAETPSAPTPPPGVIPRQYRAA